MEEKRAGQLIEMAIRHMEQVRAECKTPHILAACDAAIEALREKAEREREPLTLEELRGMNGETVYCLDLNVCGTIQAPRQGGIIFKYEFPHTKAGCNVGVLTLYREAPEGCAACLKGCRRKKEG